MWAWIRGFWRPGITEVPKVQVIIYTRSRCPLCDEAKHFLEAEQKRLGFSLSAIDVDTNPDLKARYDKCVPVVEVDGKEHFRGKINEVLWNRLW
jgi:glutaredoxin